MIAPGFVRRLTVAVAVCQLAASASASAQIWDGASAQAGVGGRGTVEVGGGAGWTGGFDLGDRSATLTRNPGTGSGPFTLFRSDTELVPSPGVQGHLAVYLSRSVSLEAGVNYSRPVLRARLSSDAEDAPALTASETLTRYVFEGSLVFHLVQLSFAEERGVPFLIGGGGHVRELHQGNELVETGREFHAGGGVKLWFGTARRRLGVRGQAVISVRDGGFDFEDGRRTLPTVSASLLYRF